MWRARIVGSGRQDVPVTPARPARPRARDRPTILHADLDAFYAAVEQRDKPSLAGKPVIVGGTGTRGVVATCSYEARAFGVHSAMSTMEARARCPYAAFLSPRFPAYQAASAIIMGQLRRLSPLVEPLSLDEAYVDLEAGEHADLSDDGVRTIAAALKEAVHEATGLTVSVGAGCSKLTAKIASDLDKPDGLLVVAAGQERDILRSLAVTRIPGVGPATAARLRSIGVTSVAELADLQESEAIGLLGANHGRGLWQLAQGLDNRPVVAERESKSVSVEDTFETDIADPARLNQIVAAMAVKVVERMRRAQLSGRTVSVKFRLHDFTTLTRSATLPAPTDDPTVVTRLARQLLRDVDVSGGLRLLGVGVSSLADWTQDDLFGDVALGPESAATDEATGPDEATEPASTEEPVGSELHRGGAQWRPGQDVMHAVEGRGWVHGSGVGWVTVRFETRFTGVGHVRSYRIDDPALTPAAPLLSELTAAGDDPPGPASAPAGYRVGMNAQTVAIAVTDGVLPLYDAIPDGIEPRGAVIVVQEAWGVNVHIRDVVARFVSLGYRAVAPALFHRDGITELPYGDWNLVKPHIEALHAAGIHADIAATVAYLEVQGFAPSSIGIVGFCMGGSIVVPVAAEYALGAAATFYGSGVVAGRFGSPSFLDLAPTFRTPWIGLFGDHDESIPVADVEKLRTAAAQAAVPTSVVRYPDAGHAFHCDARPEAYHEPSATDAWGKATEWFARYLAPHR
jgi:DNA polymerase-4